jgi:hypothetical protein
MGPSLAGAFLLRPPPIRAPRRDRNCSSAPGKPLRGLRVARSVSGNNENCGDQEYRNQRKSAVKDFRAAPCDGFVKRQHDAISLNSFTSGTHLLLRPASLWKVQPRAVGGDIPLFRGFEFAIEPAPSIGVHGIGSDLRLMDMAAPGAAQGPVLESGTGGGNVLNLHARLAFETPGPFRRARRQGGCLWIGHDATVYWAGALPNSLSPKTATDGAAMIQFAPVAW